MKVIFKNSNLIFQKSAREDFDFTAKSAVVNTGAILVEPDPTIPSKATEGYTEITDGNKNKTIFNIFRQNSWTIVGVAMYDSLKQFLGYYNPSGGSDALTFNVAISDLLTLQPTTKYIRVSAASSQENCFIGLPEE